MADHGTLEDSGVSPAPRSQSVLVRRLHKAVVVILGVAFLLQAILSMWGDAATFDETINSAVGYAELVTGDLSLVDDHPPLIRTFTALPLLVFDPNVPLNHPSWRVRGNGMADRYRFSEHFFYRVGNDADGMLFWTRLVVVILSLLLGLTVYQWAKELYGPVAGLVALFLYAFEPNLMAHSRITTNDLILTLFLFLTVYMFWSYAQRPAWKPLVLTGISLGLAFLSKFSAIMLLPILFLLALPWSSVRTSLRGDSSTGWSRRIRCLWSDTVRGLWPLVIVGLTGLAVILIFYGAQWKLFLEGIEKVLFHYHGGHSAFLMGNHSEDGWWYYFPIVFALKTPIPLILGGLLVVLYGSFRRDGAELYLWVPMAVISFAALMSHINIGVRHILPLYPFLIVLVSSIVRIRFSSAKIFHPFLAGLAGWYVVSTLAIFPGYMAYFNEIVGPQRGYRYLVDSNLDWGQDLKRLKEFMNHEKLDQIYLGYFGTADPCYYGIHSIDLPGSENRCGRANDKPARFLAVSATHLQSAYLPKKQTYEWLLSRVPFTTIGYSILVYDILDDPNAHNNIGMTYLSYGRPELALKEFKLVAQLKPQDPVAHMNLGYALGRLGAFEDAKRAYERALQLDPQNPIAKAGLKGIRRRLIPPQTL